MISYGEIDREAAAMKQEKARRVLLLIAILVGSWLAAEFSYWVFERNFEIQTSYWIVEKNGERKIESQNHIVRKRR